MLKRLLSIFTAAALLLGTVCVPAFAMDNSPVAVTEQEGLMAALGIINVDEKSNEEKISRSQFAEYLWHCLKHDALETTESIFSDVPANSKITYLAEYGYFVGNGTEFYPDREMTVNEAYTVATRVTGYDVLANVNGGSEAVYNQIAKRAGLTQGVNENDGLTFKNAMTILYNILTVPVYEIEAISSKGIKYGDSDGDTLLEIIYGIKISEGIVSANCFASIYANISKTHENSICIEKDVYECVLNGADELLGRYVTAYYNDESGRKEIVYIYADDEEDDIVQIEAQDFLNYSGNTISYYVNDRVRNISLEDDAVFIHNGENMMLATRTEKIEALNMDYGSISLYKSGRSDYYTVIITEYENAIITSVDENKELIYAEKVDGSAVKFEKDKTDFFCINNSLNDEKMGINMLKQGDFISYIASSDKKYIKIFYCAESVTGSISSISESSGEKVLTINDKEYIVNKAFAKQASFKVGISTTYLLDVFGNISYEAEGKRVGSGTIAYLYNIAEIDEGLESYIKLKVFTIDKTHNVLTIAEKCKLNGVGGKTPSEVYTALTNGAGEPVCQIFSYTVNKDGLVNSIDTAATDIDSREDKHTLWIMASDAVRKYRREDSGKYYIFNPGTDEIDSIGYPLDNSTVTFHVPSGNGQITTEEEGLFSIGNATSMTNNTDLSVSIYKYDDASPYADIVVVENADFARPTMKEVAYLVNSISRKLTGSGDIVTAVNAVSDSSDAVFEILMKDDVYFEFAEGNEIVTAAEDVENHISPGDIIQCGTSVTNEDGGKIYRYFRVLYDYSEDKTYWATEEEPHKYDDKSYTEWLNSAYDDRYRFAFGYVNSLHIEHDMLDINNAKSVITASDYNNNVKDMFAQATGWRRLTFFDDSRRGYDEAYKGIPGDIVDYQSGGQDASRIFVRWNTERPVGFIIYR